MDEYNINDNDENNFDHTDDNNGDGDGGHIIISVVHDAHLKSITISFQYFQG